MRHHHITNMDAVLKKITKTLEIAIANSIDL